MEKVRLEYFEELNKDIKSAYEQGVTLEQAERLAAKFLDAQIAVGGVLTEVDLTARMRKAGLKALKAAVYLEAATKPEKKPTESMLEALVTSNEIVAGEQKALDASENEREALQRYLDVYREAHLYFRGIGKAKFV